MQGGLLDAWLLPTSIPRRQYLNDRIFNDIDDKGLAMRRVKQTNSNSSRRVTSLNSSFTAPDMHCARNCVDGRDQGRLPLAVPALRPQPELHLLESCPSLKTRTNSELTAKDTYERYLMAKDTYTTMFKKSLIYGFEYIVM